MMEHKASQAGPSRKGIILGLISSIDIASRVAKSAKACGLSVRNQDKAAPLLECLKSERVVLILVDWDGCEAEAYRLVEAVRGYEEAKRIPVLGYVSKAKELLKSEGQRAGCDRVYSKTEFIRNLDVLLARCAL